MINAIFAVDFNGGMGLDGTLPWPHNAEDLRHFQHLTTGHVVVCGRRTWDDPKMPKPLPDRTVYVATNRSVDYAMPITGDICHQLLQLERQWPNKHVFIIGGAKLLEQSRSVLDRIYVTHIKGAYRADTRINIKEFLTGFNPVRAQVSRDYQSVFTVYTPIFKPSKNLS